MGIAAVDDPEEVCDPLDTVDGTSTWDGEILLDKWFGLMQ